MRKISWPVAVFFTLVNGHHIVRAIKKLLAGKQDDGFNPYNTKKREILSLAERAKCDWRKGPNGLDKGFQGNFERVDPLFSDMTFRSVERELFGSDRIGILRKVIVGNSQASIGKVQNCRIGRLFII